jgi:RNA polymerase sigma-70 factor (ECF subfamily)
LLRIWGVVGVANESQKFRALYAERADEVRAYLTVALGNADDAAEVTQDVFLRVFQALPRYESGSQPIDHWLFVIARHCAISHHRKNRRTSAIEPTELDARREANTRRDPAGAEWGAVNDLHVCIDAMPELQRDVVVLSYRGGLDASEIARVLGLSSAHVRQLKCRALAHLRVSMRTVALDQILDVTTDLPKREQA